MTGAAPLALPRRRRRASLTPMVDVVFLLLVFFMLVSRYGTERTIPLDPAGAEGGERPAAAWTGAPRVVGVAPDALSLNGVAIETAALPDAVLGLMPAPDAPVIVRPVEGASLQRTVAVMDLLRAAGIGRVVLAE